MRQQVKSRSPLFLRTGVICLILSGLLLVPCLGQTYQQASLSVGEAEVLQVRGRVVKVSPQQAVSNSPQYLTAGSRLTVGDRIRSAQDGYLLLGLADGSTIEMQPHTELEILDFQGGVRELFRILLGKVRLKIRKLIGAPNPYEMHTPIATIGVRGTEFDIEVERNQVTRVRVFEGLVAVENTQVNSAEVLVSAGREVTIYPLRPPDPPVTFEQVVAENFSRESSVDHPLLQKFQAFPDPHLDLLENPAYASLIVRPAGRFYLYPARSNSFASPEVSLLSPLNQFTDVRELFATDERTLQGVSSRASYVYPHDNWIVGGLYEYRGFGQDFDFRISRKIPTAFGGDVSVEQIGSSPYAPDLRLDTDRHRTVLLGAKRFPGQTVAFSYDWTHDGGSMDTLYEFRPNGILASSERARTLFSTDNRRFTLGYHRQSDSIGSVGLFYKFGLLQGRAYQDEHRVNQEPAPLAHFESSGHYQEAGGRWRKRLHRNLSLALTGSLTRTQVDEEVLNFRVADSDHRSEYWIPSVGVGLGGNWNDRVFASFDYQFSQLRHESLRTDRITARRVGTEATRRNNHALHAWLQVRLPADFFAGGGVTSFWTSENLHGSYERDSSGLRVDLQGRPQPPQLFRESGFRLNQVGLSLGKRLKDTLFLEYQLSQTRGPAFQPLSHGFLLRLAF